jgi:hypothetical protein
MHANMPELSVLVKDKGISAAIRAIAVNIRIQRIPPLDRTPIPP